MILHESEENYLEAIYLLNKEKGYVRAIDIANYLDYSKPSVSVAIKNLKEKDYIVLDDNSMISLTPLGLDKAESVYERHEVLSNILISIGVSKEQAINDACRIEHIISQETFDKIKTYFNKSLDTKK